MCVCVPHSPAQAVECVCVQLVRPGRGRARRATLHRQAVDHRMRIAASVCVCVRAMDEAGGGARALEMRVAAQVCGLGGVITSGLTTVFQKPSRWGKGGCVAELGGGAPARPLDPPSRGAGRGRHVCPAPRALYDLKKKQTTTGFVREWSSASTLVPAPTRRGLRRSVRTGTHSGYRSRVRASMAGVRMRPLRETSPLLLLGVR